LRRSTDPNGRFTALPAFESVDHYTFSTYDHGENDMATPDDLKDVYADEMKDLWSANDQMSKAVKMMAGKAHDPKLKQSLQKSINDIGKHADLLKNLLSSAGEKLEQEHCKGMEGLVKEATKHITTEAPEAGDLLDVVILAQYQRMSHYGLAGFGTAAAYATALGMKDHASKLHSIVADIHKGDDYASRLAEKAETAAKAA
jgi:ferritin-like metal-binding protein YciE